MFASFRDPMAWRRTRALAVSRGVDLARAVVDGWLRRDELDGLVDLCGTCGKDRPCSAAKSPCPNLAALDALRP